MSNGGSESEARLNGGELLSCNGIQDAMEAKECGRSVSLAAGENEEGSGEPLPSFLTSRSNKFIRAINGVIEKRHLRIRHPLPIDPKPQ